MKNPIFSPSKLRIILSVTLSMLWLQLFAAPHAFAKLRVSEDVPSYDQLKRQLPPYPLHQLHAIGPDTVKKITSGVLSNFDSGCLSNKNCRVTYSVVYTEKAIPVYKKIASQSDSPVDDFYCEQAIWEYIMSAPPLKEMIYEFSAEAKSSKHQELREKWSKSNVSLHLIPETFPLSEILLPRVTTSSSNVLKLKIEKLNDPRLLQFRREWYPVWEKPTSPKKIIDKSLMVKQKYSDLFEK